MQEQQTQSKVGILVCKRFFGGLLYRGLRKCVISTRNCWLTTFCPKATQETKSAPAQHCYRLCMCNNASVILLQKILQNASLRRKHQNLQTSLEFFNMAAIDKATSGYLVVQCFRNICVGAYATDHQRPCTVQIRTILLFVSKCYIN